LLSARSNSRATCLDRIRAGGKDQHHHAALCDRFNDGSAPGPAWRYIAGSNPTRDSGQLQHIASLDGLGTIFLNVADENVVRHGSDSNAGKGYIASSGAAMNKCLMQLR
jgi:hypothetical protein